MFQVWFFRSLSKYCPKKKEANSGTNNNNTSNGTRKKQANGSLRTWKGRRRSQRMIAPIIGANPVHITEKNGLHINPVSANTKRRSLRRKNWKKKKPPQRQS